jgi:6,7-dimethyl-8-ribityllumazine synthase
MSDYKNKLRDISNLKKDAKIAFVSAEFNKDFVESLESITEKFLEKN